MFNNFLNALAKTPYLFTKINGYQKFLISLILGVFASYAMPPWGWLANFVFSIILLIWLINSAQKIKTAAAIGFFFGFGFFAWSLLWINNALILYAQNLALLAIPFTIAIGIWGGAFCAIIAAFSFLFPKGIPRILAFAAIWTLMEWVRSWFLTGFPWNLTPSVWEKSDSVLQIISVIGPYGLSLITITLFASCSLIDKPNKTSLAFIASCFVFFAAISFWGNSRLHNASLETIENLKVRIVQPSLPQKLKWEKNRAMLNLEAYLDLTTKNLDGITHVIWGETATPYPLFQDTYTRLKIARKLPDDLVLITGVVRPEKNNNLLTLYNSALVMTGNGNIVAGYDKSHLVPFGEYIPFRKILPFNKITPGQTDFSPGNGPETIVIPNAPPVGISICYEIIFPSNVVDKNNRPKWLINLTNDGWYGISSGPFQHFFAARLRAIEEGIPVIRVANSGISGVINAYGTVLDAIPLNTASYLDTLIPKTTILTLYAKYGNFIPCSLCLFWILIAIIVAKGKKFLPTKKLCVL